MGRGGSSRAPQSDGANGYGHFVMVDGSVLMLWCMRSGIGRGAGGVLGQDGEG